MSGARERFWTGPIQSVPHARKVISYTAGTFAVSAGLFALSLLSGMDVSKVITALLFAIPSLALLRTRSLIAARILLGLSGFSAAVGLLIVVYALVSARSFGLALGMLALALFWTPFVIAAARACRAAKYLRTAPEPAAVAAA